MKKQKKGRTSGPKLQDGRLNDFSGGMNNAVHPAMLNENESALIQNNSLDEKGTLFPVKGRKKRYPDGVGSKPINGIAEYNRSDGVSRLIIGSGNSLYVDTPRLIQEYESQSNWESGQLFAVAASEKPGEIKPLSSINTSFARASTAYLSDGTEIISGQPRLEGAIKNVVQNGNFADGTTGWTGAGATLLASNNILSITGSGTNSFTNAFNNTNTPATAGKNIFLRAVLKVTNSNCDSIHLRLIGTTGGTEVSAASQISPTVNTEYIISGIVPITNQTGNIRVLLRANYSDATTANGKVMEVKEVLAIDLPAEGLESLTAEEINAGIPQWFDGRTYEHDLKPVAVIVEEGTTNKYSQDASLGKLWGAYQGSAVTITENQSDPLGTNKAVRVQASGGTSFLKAFNSAGAPLSGNVWSGQILIRPRHRLRINSNIPGIDINLFEDVWIPLKWVLSPASSDTTGAHIQLRAIDENGNYDPNGFIDCDVMMLQYEDKPYNTSWQIGGTTRVHETLTIPTAEVLSFDEGTIELDFIPTLGFLSGQSYARIIGHNSTAVNKDEIQLTRFGNTTKLAFSISNNAGQPQTSWGNVISTTDLQVGVNYRLAIRWSFAQGVYALFVNGVKESEKPLTATYKPSIIGTLAVGYHPHVNRRCNSAIGDIRISSRARTDQEIADAYASGQPLPVDEFTPLKMNFDGNLDVLFKSRWESPGIDASNAADNATGSVSLDLSTPGASSVVTSSRSSPDQQTWSDWVIAEASGKLNHPPDNYVQIALQLNKDGENRPSVKKLTANFDGEPSVELISDAFTDGGQFFFGSLLDHIAIVNYLDAPRKYDGTTLSLLGGDPPRGAYVAAHKNRLWMLRGSRLYFSDLLDIESWPILNFIDINPNDGDSGTGIYPSGDYLVITKSRSVWLLVGDSIDTYSVRRLSAVRGCLAPRSLTMINDMLCMVSDDGVYLSDFTQTVLASERLRLTWEGLNHRRLSQAVSWFHKQKLYVCLPGAGSMINDTTIVFDTLRQAWYVIAGWGVSANTLWTEAGKQVMLLGHSNEGQVSELDRGKNNAGLPIDAVWESKHFDMGYPDIVKRFRDITFMVTPDIQDVPLEVQFIVDGGPPVGPVTVTVPGRPDRRVEVVRIDPSVLNVGYARSIGFRVRQNTLDAAVGIRSMAMYWYPVADRPTIRA